MMVGEMARKKALLRFRYAFNKLPENLKSIAVFVAALGVFFLVGLYTEFSWPGIILGCLAGYSCTYLVRPLRRNHKV
jgi:EamA domain-containing membrane protein RarD